MSKPTPRPWRTQVVTFEPETWSAFRAEDGMMCITARGNVVAATWDTEADDNPDLKDQFNAAHIVKCVNLHDELLAACQAIVKAGMIGRDVAIAADLAKVAIAKAGGDE